MTGNGKDQRIFSRVPFDCDVTIIDHGTRWTTQLLDISLNGALITRPQDWHPAIGDECELQLKLSDSDIIIDMEQAMIAHIHDDRIGCKCEIIDIDSISHLKRLVELNLGDPELVHRELAMLGNN